MDTILFLAHTEEDGTLAAPALEALASARVLLSQLTGSTLVAGLIGKALQPAADQIASCEAAKFAGICGPEFGQGHYATDAAAVEALVKSVKASIVVAPGTARFNRCLAGAAQRVGGRADTHVTGIRVTNGTVTIHRWYYRQRMEAVLRREHRPWFIIVDPGSGSPWQGAAGSASVENISLTLPESMKRTSVVSSREPAPNQQTIRPDAPLLFVAGAGWTKRQGDGATHLPEAESHILDFLRLSRASLGSSKSLVDQSGEGQSVLSFLSHLNQIGQTGSTPRHPKGLSTCCHGEEPHTIGWRFIGERRAISLDPNCGWARGKADVLYVADAFAVMKKVNELLR